LFTRGGEAEVGFAGAAEGPHDAQNFEMHV